MIQTDGKRKLNRVIICCECGEQVQANGNAQKRCIPCGLLEHKRIKRESSRKARRAAGALPKNRRLPVSRPDQIGNGKMCADCDKWFVLTGTHQYRCPECKAIKDKWHKEDNRLRHPELRAAAAKRYTERYPEKRRERERVYRQAGGRKRERYQRRALAKLQPLPKGWKAAQLKSQGGKCAGCQVKMKLPTIDHIVPLSKGGDNDPANLQLLCMGCNSTKSNKPETEWRQSRGQLL